MEKFVGYSYQTIHGYFIRQARNQLLLLLFEFLEIVGTVLCLFPFLFLVLYSVYFKSEQNLWDLMGNLQFTKWPITLLVIASPLWGHIALTGWNCAEFVLRVVTFVTHNGSDFIYLFFLKKKILIIKSMYFCNFINILGV